MKQNERLLVYAVTGFLALILVIAVVFGSGPANAGAKAPADAKSLDDLLNPGRKGADRAGAGRDDAGTDARTQLGDASHTGLQTPNQVTPEQPLVAKPRLAHDLVARQLGPSQRDRNYRIVTARRGDSLEVLVRRWCGARDPYLQQARFLNEDLRMLREGQKVILPWVDDEVLAASIAAERPRTLLPSSSSPALGGAVAGSGAGKPTPGLPQPSARRVGQSPVPAERPVVAATETETYTVKEGEALWRIAARKYGRGKADRMIPRIVAANPGLDPSRLRVGQVLKLPRGE